MMSPLYPCDKPWSTRTHIETEKADPIFGIYKSNYDGITISNLEYRAIVASFSIESKILSCLP